MIVLFDVKRCFSIGSRTVYSAPKGRFPYRLCLWIAERLLRPEGLLSFVFCFFLLAFAFIFTAKSPSTPY